MDGYRYSVAGRRERDEKVRQLRVFEQACLNEDWEYMQWQADQPGFAPRISTRVLVRLALEGKCDVIAWLFTRYRIPFIYRVYQSPVFDEMLIAAVEAGSLECMKLAIDPQYYPHTPNIPSWGAKNFIQAFNVLANSDHNRAECFALLINASNRFRQQQQQRNYGDAHPI
jgi:hypothetical protein